MAFYWEGNDPADEGKITYAQLHADVCKFANVLKSKGIGKVRVQRKFNLDKKNRFNRGVAACQRYAVITGSFTGNLVKYLDLLAVDHSETSGLFVLQGDRVAMYMPMTFELVVAMLACARIGAIHSIVFGGYRLVSFLGGDSRSPCI